MVCIGGVSEITEEDSSKTLRIWNTQMKNFRRCRRKWFFADILKLEPKQPPRVWLIGDLGHRCMDDLYRTGELSVKEAMEWTLEEKYPDAFLLGEEIIHLTDFMIDLMHRYVDKYGDHDNEWIEEVLGTEEEIKVPLGDYVILELVFDLRLRTKDGIVIMDHKFTATPHQYGHVKLDPQISTYFWAANQMHPGEVYSFTLNNIMNKKPPKRSKYEDPVFHREPVRRGEYFQDEFLREMVEQAMEMYNLKIAVEEQLVSDVVLYHNPTKDCHWDCGYYNLCLTELQGGDIRFAIDNEYRIRKERVGRG